MEKRKVFFVNSRGQKLCGTLEGPADAKAGVLLIPGYASGKDEWFSFFSEYSSVLNSAGFLTFRFDRSGIGESEGDFVESTPETELDDCTAAYKYLKKMCDRVGIAGHSMGGVLAVMLASKAGVKAMVSSAPAADAGNITAYIFDDVQIAELKKKGRLPIPAEWEEKFNIRFLGTRYFEWLASFDIKGYAAKVTAPTLVVHGARDETIGVEQSKLLFEALKCEKKLKIVEGAGHDFDPHREKLFDLATAWFKKYL